MRTHKRGQPGDFAPHWERQELLELLILVGSAASAVIVYALAAKESKTSSGIEVAARNMVKRVRSVREYPWKGSKYGV